MIHIFELSSSEIIAIGLSIRVAITCTLLSLPPALIIGYIMARKNFMGKSIIESLFHLPLVLPPVTTGYLLLVFLGSKSLFGQMLYQIFGIKLAFTIEAAIIASAIVSFPLLVRSIRTSMEMVDRGLEDAAHTLGAGVLKTFFKITIPLSLPGIISGSILALARSLGEFGATITFAGNIEGETQTLPLAIFSYMQVPGKDGATMRLVIISILISIMALTLSEWYIKKMKQKRI